MPFYLWVDKKTGKEVEVLRIFADYEKPPTKEEAPDVEDPEWERQVSSGQILTRGPNWTGSKGNWLILLGTYICTQLQNWLV